MTLQDLEKQVSEEYGMYDLTEIILSGAVEFCYNKMTEGFKTRNCENCKYYGDSHCHSKEVDIMLDESGDADSFPVVYQDFGCNKFEAKDK